MATSSTKERLIEAAERLFAEQGIDAVSLREINRASGARNAIAVQYHFSDRAGVVRAILDKHMPDVESRRHAMLDQYEAERDAEPDSDAREAQIRTLAAALVRPLAAKLADADGGPAFLQIYADLLNRPNPHMTPSAFEPGSDSFQRWRRLAKPLVDETAVRLHRRFTSLLHAAVELGRRARSGPHPDDRLFTSWLIDVVAAILAAPVSPETRRLTDERDRRGGA
ncbi:MAG TPA: helix-turn-helix domain-containing protein [Acidimicrobiales bacterium]|nr:helix-turn-helix domain-containing protein [Acidimicrobiales bacterium]